MIEDLVGVRHPLWLRHIAVVSVHTSIFDQEALPGNPPSSYAINCHVEFIMVGEWYLPTRTYLEEVVYVPFRHVSLAVCQLCDFEPLLALERSPISWVYI